MCWKGTSYKMIQSTHTWMVVVASFVKLWVSPTTSISCVFLRCRFYVRVSAFAEFVMCFTVNISNILLDGVLEQPRLSNNNEIMAARHLKLTQGSPSMYRHCAAVNCHCSSTWTCVLVLGPSCSQPWPSLLFANHGRSIVASHITSIHCQVCSYY